MRKEALIVSIAVFAAGCGSGGEYEAKKTPKVTPVNFRPGDEAKLFPLRVGNQWVYSLELRQQRNDVTLKVASVRQEGGKTLATLVSTIPGGPTDESSWLVDKSGIWQTAARADAPFEPPQPIVVFPVEKGKETVVEVNGPLSTGGFGKQKVTVTYLGVQEVDTDMGRMSAMAVHSLTTWKTGDDDNSMNAVAWWVPGIGFVRQRQEITTPQGTVVVVMKLKSYSFP